MGSETQYLVARDELQAEASSAPWRRRTGTASNPRLTDIQSVFKQRFPVVTSSSIRVGSGRDSGSRFRFTWLDALRMPGNAPVVEVVF